MPQDNSIPKIQVEQEFGRWTVQAMGEKRNNAQYWLCKCKCGTERQVSMYHLLSGASTSCGCYGVEQRANSRRTHGMSRSLEYGIWSSIKDRCDNPNSSRYADYGGRGISMSEGWRQDFEVFFRDVGQRPTTRHTIERKDNDKGYEPGNVIWATYSEQGKNKRNNVRITFKGRTQILEDWAKETKLNSKTIVYRLKQGWSVEKALTVPKLGSR